MLNPPRECSSNNEPVVLRSYQQATWDHFHSCLFERAVELELAATQTIDLHAACKTELSVGTNPTKDMLVQSVVGRTTQRARVSLA